MIKLHSDSILAVGFSRTGTEKETGDLVVRFKGGREYVYSGVEVAKFDALMTSPSSGRYLRRQVIGKYPHRIVSTS